MKTKRLRKLQLGRETLRQLEDKDAAQAAGGVQTAKSVCPTICATNCVSCDGSCLT